MVYFEVCPTLTLLAGFDVSGPATQLVNYLYDLFRIGTGGAICAVRPEYAARVESIENWIAIPR